MTPGAFELEMQIQLVKQSNKAQLMAMKRRTLP
jgi:hypothetical protein